jgi:uncharacterized glyoxalase superfamily protein PhnB
MVKRPLSEQLDQAVTAILADVSPAPDPWLAGLVQIATLLNGLPSDEFRDRLKSQLEREMAMPSTTMSPIRAGFRTVTPYLAVRKTRPLIDFVKQVFGAEEFECGVGSASDVRDFRIGDSVIMIGGAARFPKPMPTALNVFVPDTDAVYRRALEAGATSLLEPNDSYFGQRLAAVGDISGNHWIIATHPGPGYIPEGLHAVMAYLHPVGANQLIDFLKRAFEATELECYRSPEGTVKHAKIKIGDSVVEIGEARDQYRPMPTVFFLYVDRVDAWYERAVGAGATSLSVPTDQPYGDRVAGVSDPSGNVWYLATHFKD